ncbi:response regulator [Aquimarina sp. W85]|uniref:response regulator n=1 Tax=Aquimarina rhodophyticola TaxID=3342246 RepID=UPI003670C3D9
MNLRVLLIEDDEIERMKLSRVIDKNNFEHKLIEAKNGEEALKILYDTTSLPNIIFLDLNMPKMNGLEFLKILKSDNRLKYLPVVILSTSNNHKDLKECYEVGIAGYITKPLKYEDYTAKIIALLNYWSINEFTRG